MVSRRYEYCPSCSRACGHIVYHEPGNCEELRSPYEYVGGQWRDTRERIPHEEERKE
jgi:hypothetical protein